VVRQLRCLEPLAVSLISGSRTVAPFGLAGGDPGACGRNGLLRADGRREELPGCCAIDLQPGEALCIETPGGGGFGPVPAAADLQVKPQLLAAEELSGLPTTGQP
jgi:5-oxoprolinase (ATP-hydrolysing)